MEDRCAPGKSVSLKTKWCSITFDICQLLSFALPFRSTRFHLTIQVLVRQIAACPPSAVKRQLATACRGRVVPVRLAIASRMTTVGVQRFKRENVGLAPERFDILKGHAEMNASTYSRI